MRSILAIAACLLLAGCLNPLGALIGGGGGPSATAIGTQIGRENTQQLVANQERVEAGRDVITETKQVEAGSVEQVTVNNQDIPIWVIVALVVGWIMPSPQEMTRGIIAMFRRKSWDSNSERRASKNSKASIPTSSGSSNRRSNSPPLTSRSSAASAR